MLLLHRLERLNIRFNMDCPEKHQSADAQGTCTSGFLMKVENVPTHHETMKNDGGTIFSSPTIPIFFSPYYFLNKLCMCVHAHTVRSNSS